MTSTTKNRFGNFGSGPSLNNNDQSRISSHATSLGNGFGSGGNTWNGGIWASTAIGSGMKSGSIENGRVQEDAPGTSGNLEGVTGSGSLLSSSELDHWNGRQATPWNSTDKTSPSLSSVHTNHTSTSPLRRQNSNQYAPPPSFSEFSEKISASSPYFSVPPPNIIGQGIMSKPSQKHFLDPTSGSFVTTNAFDTASTGRPSRHNSDEDKRRPMKAMVFGSNDMGSAVQSGRQNTYGSISGYNSSTVSRSGSLPPTRNGGNQSVHLSSDVSATSQYSQFGQPSTTGSSHRPNLSTHASSYSSFVGNSKFGDRPSPTQLNSLAGDFGNFNLGKENSHPLYATQNTPHFGGPGSLKYDYGHQVGSEITSDVWGSEDNVYQISHDAYIPETITTSSLPPQWTQYHSVHFGGHTSHSPSNSDTRRSHQSPFYSATETPSTGAQYRAPSRSSIPSGTAALLDRKLRGLQQEQQDYLMHQPNHLQFRPPYPYSYEYSIDNTIRMNQLHPPVPNVSTLLVNPLYPRGPAKDPDPAQTLRSALLQEFRSNNKTNKRYELKGIYNHIVEFSGDQHGSRFIQQKLETANSDEKDQVFREIFPNSMQLMTDVFGNYVIQKFFEHGNQSQKKILANQMKGHILTLSLQMYGCRVVQKALEHILTDQQASLVKELENHVLKCVRDQNGNHVIQKAIERVPAEHIQFIINAFTGQVQGLATHPYGCRVIQRMLEHCEEPTRTAVLQELHACASSLILDQYGNYVTQHVIEHGREEDRGKIIYLITAQLVHFSKHKFASNVVEKSIQFGSADQRQAIVAALYVHNEKGESPLQTLIRDQYGNYVVQKLLTQLKGSEFDDFVEHINPQLALLKRFAYGKQITAIEKIIYNIPNPPPPNQANPPSLLPIDTSEAPTPPLLTGDGQSPQSSSLPSTNASTTDGPVASRKSSAGARAVEVVTPNSS